MASIQFACDAGDRRSDVARCNDRLGPRIGVWLIFLLLLHGANECRAQEPVGDDGYGILAQLFSYDASLPLNARVISQFDTATFRREAFVFDGWHGSRVPGLIAVPADGVSRHPLVLLIDGIGGWKERWWQTDSWNRGRLLVDSLLASGFAVAMIDVYGSGERKYENDFVTAETFITKFPQLRDLTLQTTIEHRRLIDYLSSRPEVDSARIGIVGLSLGGMVAFYLGAFEPRVRCVVAGLTPMQRIPELLWPGHYAGHIDAPVLMLAGRKDAFYTEAQVGRVFGMLAGRKRVVWYDVGHRLPGAYAGDAADWLRACL